MAAMIEIKNLYKHFGPIRAVDGVSFRVDRGEVLGFLGPNGAGKSTTMKMVTGFLAPTSGTALVCGHDVVRESLRAKTRIGYLPEGAPLYPDMTPEGLLTFIAEVRGYSRRERKERVRRAADVAQLAGVMRQRIETLSKGYKRRVGLAQAILHDPDVLVLDEPTDGLDPNQKHEVRTLINEMAGRKAIILSTHILEEVDAVCSRAIVISYGKIVADGSPAELRRRSRLHNAVALAVRAKPDEVRQQIGSMEGVHAVESLSRDGELSRCTVVARNGKPIVTELSQRIRERGWEVDELRVEPGALDEVFRTLTTRQAGQEGSKR